MLGHVGVIFMVNVYGKDMLKSSVTLFCFNLNLLLSDLFMGEPQNPHFHDFGTLGRVPGSQNQLIASAGTPRYLKQSKKQSQIIFENIIFINIRSYDFNLLWCLEAAGAQNMKIRLTNS